MTAYDWAVVIAVGALLVLASSYRPRSQRRFQATARAAARAPRTEAEVRRDLDAAKANRWQIEQQAFNQTFNQIIAAEFPADIPPERQHRKDQP
ncbi:hypothetical protein [Streptomyces erythrochromogenes]|uniref:hypothetical protein n=1 Tax=Streptomyces erythrochromogenes TaxID=285574 RepID=UPI0037CFB0AD